MVWGTSSRNPFFVVPVDMRISPADEALKLTPQVCPARPIHVNPGGSAVTLGTF